MLTRLSRRGASIFLSALLIFSFFLAPGFSSEAARATGTVKNRILNVRSSASTATSIVCKLTQGTKVNIISETTGDDGLKWYNVYFAHGGEAKEGFVRADLVKVSGSVPSSSTSSSASSSPSASAPSSGNSSVKYVRPNVAIIRTYASTKGDIRSRLDRGTSVTILSSKTGSDDGKTWYKISFSKNGLSMEGYIRGDLLTDTNPGVSSNSTKATGTRYVSGDSVLVRSYASENGDIRSTLSKGTKVSLISSKTGDDGKTWYKVSFQSGDDMVKGYIRSDLLSEQNPTAAAPSEGTQKNTPATIKPIVANIRSYASTGGDIRSKLSQGTAVTIIDEKTGSDKMKWYKISYTYNGATMTGYIRGDLLNIGGTLSSGTNTGSSANSNTGSDAVAYVRSYASPYGDIRATLKNGTKVTILKEKTGEDGQKWTKIAFTPEGGERVEGYVPSSMLK